MWASVRGDAASVRGKLTEKRITFCQFRVREFCVKQGIACAKDFVLRKKVRARELGLSEAKVARISVFYKSQAKTLCTGSEFWKKDIDLSVFCPLDLIFCEELKEE
ncbi:hypothetical protein QL285_002822 [Trifolium repens]|nr:hypothetical protein QL285_002822 [Trifolium repens]